MDQLRALQVAFHVLDLGSFSSAARQLGVRPAAVSKQIAALEAHLGGQLFLRTTRSLAPTELGLRYLERCRPLLEELAAADQAVAASAEELSGTVTLTAPKVFGRRYLSPLVLSFMERWPRVRIDLLLTDRFVDLAAERVDLAVRVSVRLGDSGLRARRLGQSRSVLAASPAYLAQAPPLRQPADLAHHQGLVLVAGGSPTSWVFRDPEAQVRPQIRLLSDDLPTLVDGALAGLGIAAMPIDWAHEALTSGALVRLFPERFALERGVWLLRPAQRYTPAVVRALGDAVVEELRWE